MLQKPRRNSDEWPHEVREGDADPGKAPGPEDIGKDELLKALGKEDDETDEKPDEDRPSRSVLSHHVSLRSGEYVGARVSFGSEVMAGHDDVALPPTPDNRLTNL